MDIRFALITLILPALMEISGLIMMLHPPKTRNVLFGYRTKRSLLSQETWDFANYYGGTLYVYLGFYIIAVTLMTDIILKITGGGPEHRGDSRNRSGTRTGPQLHFPGIFRGGKAEIGIRR